MSAVDASEVLSPFRETLQTAHAEGGWNLSPQELIASRVLTAPSFLLTRSPRDGLVLGHGPGALVATPGRPVATGSHEGPCHFSVELLPKGRHHGYTWGWLPGPPPARGRTQGAAFGHVGSVSRHSCHLICLRMYLVETHWTSVCRGLADGSVTLALNTIHYRSQ